MDEILYELREHSAGLNCGRWDYIFSFIKKLRSDPAALLPDRGAGDDGAAVPARLHAAAHPDLPPARRPRDGRHGGADPRQGRPRRSNEAALDKVRADKLREVKDGHDGTWVAHPALVPLARAGVRRSTCRARTSSTGCATTCRWARRTCSTLPAGTAHRGGPAPQRARRRAVPGGVAGRPGLRAALPPDGGRGHRGDLAARRSGSGCTTAPPFEDGAGADRRAPARRAGRGDAPGCWRRAEERFGAQRLRQARGAVRAAGPPPTSFDDFLTLPAYEQLRCKPTRGLSTRAATAPTERGANDVRRAAHDAPAGRVPLTPSSDDHAPLGGHHPPYAPRTSSAARLGDASSTRWPSWAPGGCGSCCTEEPYVAALGALTGNQAVQMVRAGLKAIYLSGWQVAADANPAGQMYPDQSLYPVDSVPAVVRRINRRLQPRRPDRARRGQDEPPLVRADRRRRRGRLRRAAQRLRADEGDDRGGRGRRALRGPAGVARRSAATWAARCWCPPATSSAR